MQSSETNPQWYGAMKQRFCYNEEAITAGPVVVYFS